jgi:hypothetical protein
MKVGENKKGNLLSASVPEGIDVKNAATDGPSQEAKKIWILN